MLHNLNDGELFTFSNGINALCLGQAYYRHKYCTNHDNDHEIVYLCYSGGKLFCLLHMYGNDNGFHTSAWCVVKVFENTFTPSQFILNQLAQHPEVLEANDALQDLLGEWIYE